MNKKKKALFSILFFWFYILLICPSGYAKDKVNLDLIGRWGYTGSFQCIEILPYNAHSDAYCRTTGGLLILDLTALHNEKKLHFWKLARLIISHFTILLTIPINMQY